MEQPQPCTKCKKLPEDILMLACSHDLCLECASDRLAFQMKKKKPANSIVCEICYERTALDAESVGELQKLIPVPKSTAAKSYAEPRQPYDRVERVDRQGRSQLNEKAPYERQPIRDYSYNQQSAPATSTSQLLTGVSGKKNCGEHPEQEILYFCFDCKCQCICPECIIHGKHKDHDVKTIKKSAPVIKAELQKTIDKIESSIENLLIRKSEVEKSIRTYSDQNAQSKRQVQSAFEEVRHKLALKEKQIMTRFDQELNDSVQDLEKSIKGIIKKIEDLKGYSSATTEVIKREELVMLNFYAKKWKQIAEDSRDVSVNIPNHPPGSIEKILSSILEMTDHADHIALPQVKR